MVSGSLRVFRLPPPPKLVESGVKTPKIKNQIYKSIRTIGESIVIISTNSVDVVLKSSSRNEKNINKITMAII